MKIKFLFLSAVQLIFPVLALAVGNNQQYGMWPGMMGGGYSMGWPMGIFMFVFWGAIIYGIILLIRSFFSKNDDRGSRQSRSAMDILKERYARGEIDQREFEEKKRAIE